MNKLMTVLTGVSVGLFLGVILFQMQIPETESNTAPQASRKKSNGTGSKAYGKSGTYQDQSKAGKDGALTNEAKTGNTD